MEMPKPGSAHRQLERLVGAWSGTEILYPSPWDPQGSQATGRLLYRIAVDGFALVGDYEQVKNGVAVFKGHSVTVWNPTDSCYEMYWFDSLGQPPELFKGFLEGNRMQMTSKNPQGLARMSYDLSSPSRILSKMEMMTDGVTWKPFFDGTYDLVR